MKSWTLAADYLDYNLRDAAGDEIDRTLLPASLRDALDAWNAAYQTVVKLDASQREAAPTAAVIDDLDRRGQELAASIKQGREDVKEVRYYSEGLLRYLS